MCAVNLRSPRAVQVLQQLYQQQQPFNQLLRFQLSAPKHVSMPYRPRTCIKVAFLLWTLFMTCNPTIFATAIESQTITPTETTLIPTTDELIARPSSPHTITPNGVDAPEEYREDETSSPSEIQKAVCTVIAGEVKASAEAVTTKTMKGVCSSAEMDLALRNLETKLFKELQEMKQLLIQVSLQSNLNVQKSEAKEEDTLSSTSVATPLPIATEAGAIKFNPIVSTRRFGNVTYTSRVDEPKKAPIPTLKSMPSVERPPQRLRVREQEVSKFNNTMLSDRDLNVFTYYWKLENFTKHIESGENATVESPVFFIKGKSLHLQAHFQHLHRDYLYLQLEYTSLKSGQQNSITLGTGGLFREITSAKVLFKHKISILDQQNNVRSKDIVSQEFNNLETGFLIPNSALLAGPYVKNNTLLIQVFLYL